MAGSEAVLLARKWKTRIATAQLATAMISKPASGYSIRVQYRKLACTRIVTKYVIDAWRGCRAVKRVKTNICAVLLNVNAVFTNGGHFWQLKGSTGASMKNTAIV